VNRTRRDRVKQNFQTPIPIRLAGGVSKYVETPVAQIKKVFCFFFTKKKPSFPT